MKDTKLARLALKPKIWHTLTGLTPCQFIVLLAQLRPHWTTAERKRKDRPDRKRAIGAGPKPKLSLAGDLFMILLFYRTYTQHSLIGLIVGLDESNVGRRIRCLEPILQRVFKVPTRKINLTDDEILELIFDGTEQDTQRRKGSKYSGKKKRHTIKTQVVVSQSGRIQAVSASVTGNTHDKKLYDQARVYVTSRGQPERVKRRGDLAYEGTDCATPIKKPKGRPLRMREKHANRQFSRQRIIVEHEIGHLKQFKVLGDRYRNPLNRYDLIFRNVVGLRQLVQAAPA